MNLTFRCLLLYLLLRCSVLHASETRIDSLQSVLRNSKLSDAEKLSSYELLGMEFENSYQAAEATEAYRHAVALCRKSDNKGDKLSSLLYQYAVMATYAGDYDNAISALDETLKQTEQYPNETLRARTLMQTGMVYFFQQKWDQALYFYQQALNAAEKLKNREGISIAYNNIANIYQKQQQPKQAFDHYNKIGYNEIIALCYMHLGVLYSKTGEIDKAAVMLKQAEELSLETGYEQVRQEILHTASTIFFEAGN